MKRAEAIRTASEATPEGAIVIASNGHVSRELFAATDREGHFYMIGSMGLAPSIALGIKTARPELPCVVFDGDGNVLMNLGNLASVGARKPRGFTHLCFDNGQHASTGGQRTISRDVALEEIAAAAGYGWTRRVRDVESLAAALPEALAHDGPSFLLCEVEPGGLAEGTARVDIEPREMGRRIRDLIASGSE